MSKQYYVLFDNVENGKNLYRLVQKAGIDCTIAPTPREADKCCGITILYHRGEDTAKIKQLAEKHHISVKSFFEKENTDNPNLLNYFMLPRRKLKARNVLPGTIFCAVGMLIVTFFYSQYTARAVNNNLLYGSMASVSVLMFWFYFISWVFVLGIILNKVWADIKSE